MSWNSPDVWYTLFVCLQGLQYSLQAREGAAALLYYSKALPVHLMMLSLGMHVTAIGTLGLAAQSTALPNLYRMCNSAEGWMTLVTQARQATRVRPSPPSAGLHFKHWPRLLSIREIQARMSPPSAASKLWLAGLSCRAGARRGCARARR